MYPCYVITLSLVQGSQMRVSLRIACLKDTTKLATNCDCASES